MQLLRTRPLLFPPLVGLLLIAAFLLGGRTVAAADAGGYQQTNLVSNLPGVAPVQDPDLLNPWGLVSSGTSPWWVSDNNAGVSTLYTGAGAKVALTVTIPAPASSAAGTLGAPTGVVFNSDASGFLVPGAATPTPSHFIFDTENGTVEAWGGGGAATIAVDNSAAGAIYKGLAMATSSAGDRQLYATNFGEDRIDVFNTSFAPVTLPAGAFTDPRIPASFSPFGIENIGGLLFVTYAMPNGSGDEVLGQGLGFIDVFNTDGTLVQRFARHGLLNAPWGMAVAPAGFGQFGGDLLVGNFGDGHVDAYNMSTGELLGPLQGTHGRLTIDGLWALAFGNGAAAGPTSTLFFTAGPNDQADGLFGTVTPATS